MLQRERVVRARRAAVWVILLAAIVIAVPARAHAQAPATIQIRVTQAGHPVEGAAMTIGSATQTTDPAGVAQLQVPAGPTRVTVSKEGFAPATLEVTLTAGERRDLAVALERIASVEEAVTVSATRTGGRIDDIPTRVEVLNREEIEEKMLMTPGDIVMMLNEMGGLRVQATSPGLGAATVRVQGMRGRYTRFFSDGLPLLARLAASACCKCRRWTWARWKSSRASRHHSMVPAPWVASSISCPGRLEPQRSASSWSIARREARPTSWGGMRRRPGPAGRSR